jgi:hypothetical protein
LRHSTAPATEVDVTEVFVGADAAADAGVGADAGAEVTGAVDTGFDWDPSIEVPPERGGGAGVRDCPVQPVETRAAMLSRAAGRIKRRSVML